jgi:hypothetical protein
MIGRLAVWSLLIIVFVSAMPWEVAVAQPAEATQEVASPSAPPLSPSDPGPPGDPCSDSCLFPCCPGHVLAPLASDTAVGAAVSIDRAELPALAEDLHSNDFSHRIFHPPKLV